ncbi:RNA 2',3'-cyclic phosphodiesterase [candidate division WOR-3 bacterium]|nr:RNA 2',3'-cyclic phosphodiesterase [candidate division WOR-3 bacterium]
MRAFVAIEIPEHIRKSVHERIETFRTSSLPVKWVAYSNLHITLKFLGEITEENRISFAPLLENIAVFQKPITITLKDFGCFPNSRRPRVAWVGVDQGSEMLSVLAENVEEALSQCGFPAEGRFHSHLTIGRIKKPCSLDSILEQQFESEPFNANALVLFKSTLTPQGAVYQALERYEFEEKHNA